ncbi:MAG: flagellar motor switch protein FliN [Parvibaculaceae bacterium]
MAEQEDGMDLPDLTDEDSLPATEEESAGDVVADDETRTAADLEAVFDIPVNVSAVLGKTGIEISELLKLDAGAVVELDRKVGEAIDIYVNDRLVARGEVVIVEEQLGVTMTEIIKGGAN